MAKVDVSLADFDTDDLLDELKSRYENVVFAAHDTDYRGVMKWKFVLNGKSMGQILASTSYLHHTALRTTDLRTGFSEPRYNITGETEGRS